MHIDDTIVAVSSSAGAAPRGIIRLSGPEALRITGVLFVPMDGSRWEGLRKNACLVGHVRVGPAWLPASLYCFLSPRSYTRQDVTEFHLLGAPAVMAMLVEACLAAGARLAEPGEFTARAWLSGAMDLSQVHAVAGVIGARSDAQLQAAQRLLHGDLSRTAMTAREDLADLLSLVEGAMDFADEPIEFITSEALRDRLRGLHDSLTNTLDAGVRTERWDRLPRVVLVGRTNVGKSSLVNRLSGIDRAICAPLRATTRDALAVPLALEDGECLLMDVAGLGDAMDALDARAQENARRCIREADLLLHVLDATEPSCEALASEATAPVVHVANKCDLLAGPDVQGLPQGVILTSAKTGAGCDQLKTVIAETLRDRDVDVEEGAVALMAEHRDALNRAVDCLVRARALVEEHADPMNPTELVAAELRMAAAALGELVGREQTEEMLGRIFSRFCVGK